MMPNPTGVADLAQIREVINGPLELAFRAAGVVSHF
jgi:hypothetical protein